jgi:hypothetical protein
MIFPRIALPLLLMAPMTASEAAKLSDALVVHEWGTFTSVAGADGGPVGWSTLLGSADLPCFVDALRELSPKLSAARVRMETPVLYFYSQRPVTLSVAVKFPQGWITEWFPSASAVRPAQSSFSSPYANGEIRWDDVEVLPGPDPEYPKGKGASPYYAARETDAAPLRIGKEHEKLIFYRGIGNFVVPVRAAFGADGALEIRNADEETIPLVILFENQGGRIGYRSARGVEGLARLAMPELHADFTALRRELVGELVELGLYRAEADAMLETWSHSWFEEGARVMYIVPRQTVDSLLPLEVEPAPTQVARVFVGRVEVLSPWTRREIEEAAVAGDSEGLARFGRFLTAFAPRIAKPGSPAQRAIDKAVGTLLREQLSGPGCVQ